MALRLLFLAIILTIATLGKPSQGASLEIPSHGDIQSTKRFLREINEENEERTVATDAISTLAKNKDVVLKIVETNELPAKVTEVVKKYPLVIPGVSAAFIKLRMKLWFRRKVPPTFVFKALGLRGLLTDELLHGHPFYKYFAAYQKKWAQAQRFLEF
ncbi:RxLR effector protein [Phytophthora megakarya]|uniref:RxLR effector protein n=1 Tax=Phytophthora megakarya TaxID=4795 RepID=A0A225WDC9_9STRA|nr:RxLR effector protein [Phytophthora megakarya]